MAWTKAGVAVVGAFGLAMFGGVALCIHQDVEKQAQLRVGNAGSSPGGVLGPIQPADAAPVRRDTPWSVVSQKDKLTDQTAINAVMTHAMSDGGKIVVEAGCEPDAVKFTFEYHDAKDTDKGLYETNGNSIAVAYRLDGGEVKTANETAQYGNSANVTFFHADEEDRKEMNGNSFAGKTMLLASIAAGDLRALLHAHRARFQLPVSGKEAELVEFDPQARGLQEFYRACTIDVRAIDRDAAEQQAKAEPQSGGGQ